MGKRKGPGWLVGSERRHCRWRQPGNAMSVPACQRQRTTTFTAKRALYTIRWPTLFSELPRLVPRRNFRDKATINYYLRSAFWPLYSTHGPEGGRTSTECPLGSGPCSSAFSLYLWPRSDTAEISGRNKHISQSII